MNIIHKCDVCGEEFTEEPVNSSKLIVNGEIDQSMIGMFKFTTQRTTIRWFCSHSCLSEYVKHGMLEKMISPEIEEWIKSEKKKRRKH